MKIDRPPVIVCTLELTSKKVLVWLCATDKGKEEILSSVTFAHQIYHTKWLLRRLWTRKRQIRREVPRGKHDRIPDHGTCHAYAGQSEH
jgi:hypothetical protein